MLPELITPPVNVTVALGQISPAVFSCLARGGVNSYWNINESIDLSFEDYNEMQSLREERGITYFSHHNVNKNTVNITLNISVTTAMNNNTRVTCIVRYLEDPNNVTTSDAVLTIAGSSTCNYI